MTITPRIILNNLSFHLEATPVSFERINLSFEAKKYGVVGPNGVGKSTFLKLLLGVLIPDAGSIRSYHGCASAL
jgi:ABC-type Mn2+/Zn2+ transport system ATPase subunit